MIEMETMSKYYGDKKAVSDLSFSISEGEIVGLLGLNGAGKSTILKILGCFLLPSVGRATVGGHSVATEAQEVRKIIGYLPATPPLYNEMTVRSYLEFVARLKEVPATISDNIAYAMDKTNLLDVENRFISQLSHGYRQRVGIAQALVHRPKVLILDEPINGLDPIQIAEMRDLILSLKGQHTVILSSHILSEITKTCDRILVIDQGQLVAEGSETELKAGSKADFDLRVDVKGDHAPILSQLEKIEGLSRLKTKNMDGFTQIFCHCQLDVRSQIAKTIVDMGGELVHMAKEDGELESLFFRLVKSEGKS